MAACGLPGPLSIKKLAPSISAYRSKLGSIETFIGTNKAYTLTKSVQFPCLVHSQKNVKFLSVTCGASSKKKKTDASSVAESLNEEMAVSLTNNYLPTSSELETLLTEICDTSIAEFELKLGGFRMYVKRNIEDKKDHVAAPDPPAIVVNQITEELDTNGSVSSTSLAISKPNHYAITVQSLLDSPSNEGLAILQSPKVGFFRRSKTIKGKRAPPCCKQNQIVKEGQVLCFIEQLGGEIPIESDVSGEIVKILRKDGEPVGYGDALIAVLPSFPGIKKLQ